MTGIKGKSGRKRKNLSRADAQRRMSLLAPLAVDTIRETLEGGNEDRLRYEAAMEVYNHNFGKPKVRTELEIGVGELPSGLQIAYIMQYRDSIKLLEQDNGTQRTSKEGLSEGVYEEAEASSEAK